MIDLAANPKQHGSAEPDGEAVLLITCLRDLPFLVPHDTDWHNLLGLAAENGVLALVYHSLLKQNAEMPAFFTASAREVQDAAERMAAELEILLERFSKQGIEVLPMKGPVLAETLYADATMRSSNDLDLLVRSKDYPRAEALLLDMGFAACEAADDYHRMFQRNGLPVELHFDIASPRYFPFDAEGVWNRAGRGEFRGKSMRVMAEDDLLFFLCMHGLKHGFSRMIWVLDVARALANIQACSYKELTQRAQRRGLEPWLLMGCEVVREMFPQQLPQAMDAVIAESPEVSARARRAVARLIAEGFDVINDHKIRSFYLQTERSARRRWLCRLSFFQPSIEDYRWAERHRISRSLAPIFRPFRLLQRHGASRVLRNLFPRGG